MCILTDDGDCSWLCCVVCVFLTDGDGSALPQCTVDGPIEKKNLDYIMFNEVCELVCCLLKTVLYWIVPRISGFCGLTVSVTENKCDFNSVRTNS